jgi:hypothetical protein
MPLLLEHSAYNQFYGPDLKPLCLKLKSKNNEDLKKQYISPRLVY